MRLDDGQSEKTTEKEQGGAFNKQTKGMEDTRKAGGCASVGKQGTQKKDWGEMGREHGGKMVEITKVAGDRRGGGEGSWIKGRGIQMKKNVKD